MTTKNKEDFDAEIIDDRLIIPDDVADALRLRPDDYIEIFSYSGIGQMEFSGISYMDDDNSISLPDEILKKIEHRKNARITIGRDVAMVRVESDKDEDEKTSRERRTTAGTLTTKKPPIEMRLYKHICEVIRYGTSKNYVPLGNTCALCGVVLKGREHIQPINNITPICVRCGKEVRGNFCSNCGLKLKRREQKRQCSKCRTPVEYIEKYNRFFCPKCKKYEPAKKPGLKTATCPDCGGVLSFVKKYDNFYCFACKGYRKPLELTPEDELINCPDCDGNLTYVEKYDRFYCRKCRSYKEVVSESGKGAGSSGDGTVDNSAKDYENRKKGQEPILNSRKNRADNSSGVWKSSGRR